MPSLYNPPPIDDILTQPRGVLQHTPEVHLGKVAIHHPLQEVYGEPKIPFPPGRPLAR